MRKLVLASTSQSRLHLLKKLEIPFESASPNVDETHLVNESPEALVSRLALAKAKAVASLHNDAIIIGADQVGVVEGKIIGKPDNIEIAKQHLKEMSGKRIRFYVGICLLQTKTLEYQLELETYDVVYRNLTDDIIDQYLRKEQPLNCAGSCNADGIGINLIEEFCGKDFSALIGLPLIRLTKMLKDVGHDPLYL